MDIPHSALSELGQHAVRWTGGFWKERFDLVEHAILPNIYRLFDDDEISHCLANFRIACGDMSGEHRNPAFQDGDFFKWLEGASFVYGTDHDPKLKELIDSSVDLIARTMREDGYLFTRQLIAERCAANGERGALSNSLNFEVYNMGHLITAGCVHYRATGERTLLDLAERAAMYLNGLFLDNMDGKAKTAICPSHYMALIELYEVTAKQVYLDTAKLAIELRDRVTDGTDDNQDRVPFAQQTEVLGHAVRATYLYAGVTDLYRHTGDEALMEVLQRLHDDMTTSKLYINGGCGALYDGVSPSGYAGDHPGLQRTHQSFGRPYELPNSVAYNETCATIGNIFWNWRMFLATGLPKYVDIIETGLYNLVLASVSLDGLKYFYSNMLRRDAVTPYFLKWSRTREEYLSSFCCPPNMMRLLAQSSRYAYAVGYDHVDVALYGQSEAKLELGNGVRCTLVQTTGYPYDGLVTIRHEGACSDYTLNVRIPSWVVQATMRLPDGSVLALDASHAGSFVPVTHTWCDGDSVTIDFQMPVMKYVSNAHVEENNMHVALMRGPLLYCLEACDNQGSDVASLGISGDAGFEVRLQEIAGVQVPVLVTASGRSIAGLNQESGALYRPCPTLHTESSQAVFVPYFAWDNRDYGVMKVWIPLYV